MRSVPARRAVVIGWPIVLGALVFAACGGDDGAGPTRSTVDLSQDSTAFVVRPTTPPSSAADETPGEVTTNAQEYVVQAGDYPLGVANKFGVELDELIAFNGWASAGEFPFPGETILIPPGGIVQGAADEAASESATASSVAGDAAEGAGDTVPAAGDNCAEGTYTIQEGDSTRLAVAEKFDVTVEALDAANAGTPGYNAFYPGLEIIIPAKADC